MLNRYVRRAAFLAACVTLGLFVGFQILYAAPVMPPCGDPGCKQEQNYDDCTTCCFIYCWPVSNDDGKACERWCAWKWL